MNKTLLIFGILFALQSLADERAYQQILNAMAVCPADQNPALVLPQFKANTFLNAQMSNGETANAEIALDPRLLNSNTRQPIMLLGTMSIQMSYPAPGFGLVCKLTAVPHHWP